MSLFRHIVFIERVVGDVHGWGPDFMAMVADRMRSKAGLPISASEPRRLRERRVVPGRVYALRYLAEGREYVGEILRSLGPGDVIETIDLVGHGSPGCLRMGGTTTQDRPFDSGNPGSPRLEFVTVDVDISKQPAMAWLAELVDAVKATSPALEVRLLGCCVGRPSADANAKDRANWSDGGTLVHFMSGFLGVPVRAPVDNILVEEFDDGFFAPVWVHESDVLRRCTTTPTSGEVLFEPSVIRPAMGVREALAHTPPPGADAEVESPSDRTAPRSTPTLRVVRSDELPDYESAALDLRHQAWWTDPTVVLQAQLANGVTSSVSRDQMEALLRHFSGPRRVLRGHPLLTRDAVIIVPTGRLDIAGDGTQLIEHHASTGRTTTRWASGPSRAPVADLLERLGNLPRWFDHRGRALDHARILGAAT